MRPLFIPLKTEYFRAFQNGTKDTEYRPFGPRWNHQTCPVGRAVTLSHGYGKKERLSGVVADITILKDPGTRPGWVACYGNRPGDAIAITIKLTPPAPPTQHGK